MSKIAFVLTIFVFFTTSCKKDVTDEIDITEYSWVLEYIKIDSDKTKPDNKYTLSFNNDSIFTLNLSINTGGGKYEIKSKGNISVFNYEPLSELCCENDFDKDLLQSFPKVNKYEVLKNDLIFTGEDIKIVFKK